tara:strand:- start:1269 stop:2723 length:1455 start_codon:yes stop_codon:yes gene_type:complete
MSNGIGKNPLIDISKVYLNSIAEAAVEPPKEKLKTDRNMFNIPKDEQASAKERLLAKAAAKREKMKEALDPVGQEDSDIDNDGDVDKSDKYLGKRRKAIAKAMKKRMKKEEVESEAYEPMTKERQMKVDRAKKKAYDADQRAQHKGDSAEADKQFKRRMAMDSRTKMRKESFSSWRTDLSEIISDIDDDKPIKEKKVTNKIKINPKLDEEVEEMGGVLIEEIEISETDHMIGELYTQFQEEGYNQEEIEEALEYAFLEATVTFGSDTKAMKKDGSQVGSRSRFLKRKAGQFLKGAKKKAGMASAQAQVAAYNKGREVAQTAKDKARKAKGAVSSAPKKAKKGLKSAIKDVAQKVVSRMSEESEIDPKERQALAKKKQMMMKQQMLDKQRLQAQQQGKLPSGHRVEQKESMSAFEKVKAELVKKHGAASIVGTPENKAATAKSKSKAEAERKKRKPTPDTRTDAQRMADAYASPRKGPGGATRAD